MEELRIKSSSEPDNKPRDSESKNIRTAENLPPSPQESGPGQKDGQRRQSHHDSRRSDPRHVDDAADGGIYGAGNGSDRPHKRKGESGQRQTQPFGDVNVASQLSPISKDEAPRLYREVVELRCQLERERERLEDERSRVKQAERVAEDLRAHQKKRDDELHSSIDQAHDALIEQIQKLQAELEDARSHIFSLQPYRQELTPKKVGQEFDSLVNSITDWVQKFAEPVVGDRENLATRERFENFLSTAKKRPDDITKLRRYIGNWGDLVQGCQYPETDLDILTSIVIRYVHDNIFQKILFGDMQLVGEVVSQIEGSMQSNVEPKRDQYAIRTWRAETFNAIICSNDYKVARAQRMRELTLDLAPAFSSFHQNKDGWSRFLYSCQEHVIRPAMDLHEKLLTSTHHFYLDLNPYIVWNSRRELEISPDFFDNLDKLQCENILQHRKPFNLAKLDPQPTRHELRENLKNVLTLVPGLWMRQVGRGDVIKEPIVVRKQQVLVAYGPQEKMQRFVDHDEHTLMRLIYFSHRPKQEHTFTNPWGAWKNSTLS